MAKGQCGQSLRQLSTLLTIGTVGGLTDRQLVELFVTQRDEVAELAFAAIVDRHGPMVLRVCHSVLRNADDAHDAFQATFLVLVSKSRGLWVGESLAPWLHQVAHRTACCARSARARRRRHEQAAMAATCDVAVMSSPDDLGAVLHEEVERLPERYRAAVVHCLVEGQTPEQAALYLGWPTGTVRSRLARGRERLRERLTRRGVVPSVFIGAHAAALEVVPDSVAWVTVQAGMGLVAGRAFAGSVTSAVALMEGVLKMMFWSRVKVALPVVLASALVCGTGVVGYRALGRSQVGEAGTKKGARVDAREKPSVRDLSVAKTPELVALGKARVEVAKELKDVALRLMQNGRVEVAEYLRAEIRYYQILAEVEPEDSVRHLTAAVEGFKKVEDMVRVRFANGQVSTLSVLEVKLSRLDAEYALAIAEGKMGKRAD
jgi:RNA polymerase sigma factor (sigma-70 family)